MDYKELRKLAEESRAWKDAGCECSDPYDTYPADLFHAFANEQKVIELIDEVFRLTGEVSEAKNKCLEAMSAISTENKRLRQMLMDIERKNKKETLLDAHAAQVERDDSQ